MKPAVYRLFDKGGALLYVGSTINAFRRIEEHRCRKAWFDQVVRIDVHWCASRDDARVIEQAAITTERPAHNLHVPPPPKDRRYQSIPPDQLDDGGEMISLNEAIQALRANPHLSAPGVSERTLRRLRNGHAEACSLRVLQALDVALRGKR